MVCKYQMIDKLQIIVCSLINFGSGQLIKKILKQSKKKMESGKLSFCPTVKIVNLEVLGLRSFIRIEN